MFYLRAEHLKAVDRLVHPDHSDACGRDKPKDDDVQGIRFDYIRLGEVKWSYVWNKKDCFLSREKRVFKQKKILK